MITAKGEIDPKQLFDLKRTLKCAQGHRWRPVDDIEWSTVFNDYVVRIRQKCRDAPLSYESKKDKATVEAKLRWQFRLQRDDENVEKVYAKLEKDAGTGKDDPHMKQLVNDYRGLRVMRVDPWECLVFFIQAAHNQIQATHERMELIAEKFGGLAPGSGRFTFTRPQDVGGPNGSKKLQELTIDDPSSKCRQRNVARNKADAISEAGLRISDGVFDLTAHVHTPQSDAQDYRKTIRVLDNLSEVGDKTANCVALFALGYLNGFPVDTHIFNGLKSLYSKVPAITQINPRAIKDGDQGAIRKARLWAQDKFGPYAGYASQFLFIHDYDN